MLVRAIDLYAGVGGWSLGLRLAGIEVVASYEWWQPALDTYSANLRASATKTNIRELHLSALPKNIDLVVGSPPCTQFSYSNRGGSGDIADGFVDIVKFLEVVNYLKPKYWVMENVPRVAKLLKEGFKDKKHPLYKFRSLEPTVDVFDFADFGLPQSRQRCIAGTIPFDLIREYRSKIQTRTLGDVVQGDVTSAELVDPVWSKVVPASKVTELRAEAALNAEELRMNKDSKVRHPIYNKMAFPDRLDRAARTVTATCTRVSRESIVIEAPDTPGKFRRLTIRERASLQGFPITYQFFGRTFSEKAKMVGNAIPPTFTLLVGLAVGKHSPEAFNGFSSVTDKILIPDRLAPETKVDGEGRTYPHNRSFRAAMPCLHFKSGMRFELSNSFEKNRVTWRMRYFFGPSKAVIEVPLTGRATTELLKWAALKPTQKKIAASIRDFERRVRESSPQSLQSVWSRMTTGDGPYLFVDELDEIAASGIESLEQVNRTTKSKVVDSCLLAISRVCNVPLDKLPSSRKLAGYSRQIIAGLFLGDAFNKLAWHRSTSAIQKRDTQPFPRNAKPSKIARSGRG